jgi:hypothetical protein
VTDSTERAAPGSSRNATPWQLGVRCDHPGCEVVFEADFWVPEDSTRDDRLRIVLKRVENVGWAVEYPQGSTDPGEAVTFCPSCVRDGRQAEYERYAYGEPGIRL